MSLVGAEDAVSTSVPRRFWGDKRSCFCLRMSRAVSYMTSDMFLTFWIDFMGVNSTNFLLNEGGPRRVRNGANWRTSEREKMVGLLDEDIIKQSDLSESQGGYEPTSAPLLRMCTGCCAVNQEDRTSIQEWPVRQFQEPPLTSIPTCQVHHRRYFQSVSSILSRGHLLTAKHKFGLNSCPNFFMES